MPPLRVISAPAGALIRQTAKGKLEGQTLISGEEPDQPSYTCGACGHVLIERTNLGMISGATLECPACQAYNHTPITKPPTTR